MSLAQLVAFPRHLLAATVERGRERYPVRVRQVGPSHVVVSATPLARGERARVRIQCPLSADACEITAEAVDIRDGATWLALVA